MVLPGTQPGSTYKFIDTLALTSGLLLPCQNPLDFPVNLKLIKA